MKPVRFQIRCENIERNSPPSIIYVHWNSFEQEKIFIAEEGNNHLIVNRREVSLVLRLMYQ